jgi:ElaB/YqjD/DUF883 family membrane-anchored ribosome-binding protein
MNFDNRYSGYQHGRLPIAGIIALEIRQHCGGTCRHINVRRLPTMVKKKDEPQTVHKEIQHIMNHAQALVDATSGELDDRIKAARAALNERLESAKGEYGELEGHFLEKVKAADAFIHEKPYHAISGTLIAGLFLGWFIGRK